MHTRLLIRGADAFPGNKCTKRFDIKVYRRLQQGITSEGTRITRIFGSEGDITGDLRTIKVANFSSKDHYVWDASKAVQFESGHMGGDHGLVHDFVRAVSFRRPDILSSTIQVSMASHLMGFRAEKSRLNGTVEDVNL